MNYKRRFQWLDRRNCYTAHPPLSATTGRLLQRAWSNLSQWHERQLVFLANGVPDLAIMLAPIAGTADYEGVLHFAHRIPATAGAAVMRQYGCHIWEWGADWSAVGQRYAQLIRDYVAAPGFGPMIGVSAPVSAPVHTYGDGAQHFVVRYDDMTLPAMGGAYHHAAIRLRNVIPAAVSVYPVAPPPADLTAAQEQALSSVFGVGQVIRGLDEAAPPPAGLGSVGTLTRLIGDGTVIAESAELMTRRLLWSWAHPVGLWFDNFEAGVTVWDTPIIRTLPRDLIADVGGTIRAEPVFILQGSEGVVLTLTSGAGAWSYTIPAGGLAVPTMVTPAMGAPPAGLLVAADVADGVSLTATAPARADWCLIHTCQGFEGAPW